MTRVYVYVEGPSDKAALEALLAPLLAQLRAKGVMVVIFGEASGDRKKGVLLKVPERAVNILHSQPRAYVVAMPDLYPKNRGFPHETYEELADGILESFRGAVHRKKLRKRTEMESRFRVFCFKHDMEALRASGEDPRASGRRPSGAGSCPSLSGNSICDSGKRPSASGFRPCSLGRLPRSSGGHPRASGSRPDGSGSDPRASGKRPPLSSAPGTR